MNTRTLPISVKGIVFENDKVWLRRNERNEWELPGGKLDPDEQPSETCAREIQEELGLRVHPLTIVNATVITIKGSLDESGGVLVLSYVCQIIERTGEVEHVGEAGKALFQQFSMEELTDLSMPSFYKEAIHAAAQQRVK